MRKIHCYVANYRVVQN